MLLRATHTGALRRSKRSLVGRRLPQVGQRTTRTPALPCELCVSENGTRLQQSLRCASDSYRFDVNANIVSEGGTLSGSWTETSRNASGSVSGRVSGGQIQAKIDGAGFSASLVVSTRGDRQSVTIEAPGHEVTEVSVALTRAR